jgi:hypothetical protein
MKPMGQIVDEISQIREERRTLELQISNKT